MAEGEPTVKFLFKPGINREATNYANEGGWWDCDKIRFRNGLPEKIGGWAKVNTTAFVGICRALHPWTLLAGTRVMAVGTHKKLYILSGQALYDITPIRKTTNPMGNNPFATTNGSAIVTVTDTNHGATVGSYVTFSGASTFNNVNMNGEFVVVTVVDANTYTVTATTVANAAGSGGGAVVIAAYQINIGDESYSPDTGWGSGGWGSGPWGGPSGSGSGTIAGNFRLWFFDNWGEDLVAQLWNGATYYWDASGGFNTRAALLSTIAGASNTPVTAYRILISETDRHAVAFGVNPLGDTAIDPLLIRWADTENIADWTPTEENAAGDLRVARGSRIVAAVKSRQEILFWTDVSMHSLRFVGNDFVFGTAQTAEALSIMGPNAAVSINDIAFWMGKDSFYSYTGRVISLPCSVNDYVFNDINIGQAAKVFCATNSSFDEIIWFYPSADSEENNRYVIFNITEQTWYYGTMERTAWTDRSDNTYPDAAAPDGFIYDHEFGLDDGSENPAVAINAYVTSSFIDIGDGHHLMRVKRIIPDLNLYGSTANGSFTYTLTPKYFPGAAPGTPYVKTVTPTGLTADSNFTDLLRVSVRGRQMQMKIESNETGMQWRIGATRFTLRPDGRKS